MDFDAVAAELYGLPLADFVATRKEREKQARDGKDKELAAQIHRLAKPNTVAWLANQLVRHHSSDIQSLLELGSEMREATVNLSGDRLRELSRQQHELIRLLVQQAALANSADRQLGGDVARGLEETFHAALADQDASHALAAGRLTAGLTFTGFGGLDGRAIRQPGSAAKPRPAAEDRSRPPRGAERPKRAVSGATKARSVAAEAVKARETVHTELQQAKQSLANANDQVEQLRRALDEASELRSKAKTDLRRVQAEYDRLDRRAQDAQRQLDALQGKRSGR